MPEVDAIALAQLLRLEPEVAGDPLLRRSVPRRLTSSPRYQPLVNRNEGGVDGIFQTRRLGDLPGMPMNELLNPRPLFFERLLQSGYMALRRPPLAEKQRDVLIAGVLPPAPSGVPSAMARAFVKAAWFDAVTRLAVWLRRAGLRRSELLWIEPDASARRRESRCLLEDLPESLPVSVEPSAALRRELLAALGWLPDFLDLQGAGHGKPPSAEPIAWSTAAWRHVRTMPGGGTTSAGATNLRGLSTGRPSTRSGRGRPSASPRSRGGGPQADGGGPGGQQHRHRRYRQADLIDEDEAEEHQIPVLPQP